MSRFLFLFILSATITLLCEYDLNRYNPNSADYKSPCFVINRTLSTLPLSDTINSDTLRLILTGNDPYFHNQFRYALDSSTWSEWSGDGEKEYHIELTPLQPGPHALSIQVCYHPTINDFTDSTISFYRVQTPVITDMSEPVLRIDAGAACTLHVNAKGTGELEYYWYRNGEKMDSTITPSFILLSVDSVTRWHCGVKNSWGEITSKTVTIYPQYSLSFDGNGAITGIVPQISKGIEGEFIALPANPGSLVITGYNFVGWNTATEGTGTGYKANDWYEVQNCSASLYAQWSPFPIYTIIYDPNGADSGATPSENYFNEGDTFTVAGNIGQLFKDENSFIGWNTDPGGKGTAYQPNDQWVIGTTDDTLYAQWTTNPVYTLTYIGNGSTRGKAPSPITTEAGDTFRIASCGVLTKKGYTFTIWTTEADSGGTFYKPGDTCVMDTVNDTLYGQWEIGTFTIVYVGNGSTGGVIPEKTTHLFGAETRIAKEKPSRTGHTFFRWNTSADGSGIDYQPGDPLIMPGNDMILFAKWITNNYVITFYGNGNTTGLPPLPDTVLFGDSIIIPPQKDLSKTECVFSGWNSKPDGTGVKYSSDTTIIMGASDLELYAQWKINQYIVVFDSRGGIPEKIADTLNYGSLIPAVSNPVKLGNSFKAWYKDSTDATAAWDFSKDMVYTNLSLFAGWNKNRHIITYHGNGNTSGTLPGPDTVFYSDNAQISSKKDVKRTGYVFTGWNTDSSGIGKNYPADTIIIVDDKDLVLFAQWDTNRYVVTFDSRGGSSVGEKTVTYNAVVTEPEPPTKTGYTFKSWHIDSACATTAWQFSDDKVSGDMTLYAKWEINVYRVAFDSRGGSTIPDSTVEYNGLIIAPANPTKTGYTFEKWYKDSVFTTLWDFSTDRVTGDTRLYADWIINRHTITYYGNTNDSGSAPQSTQYNYGVAVTIPGNTGNLKKTGYTFSGWNSLPGGNGVHFPQDTVITMGDADIEMYVEWKINSYIITFNTLEGSTVPDTTVKYGDLILQPASPNRTGYTFEKWCKDSSCTVVWNFNIDKVTDNLIIYAQWKLNRYNLTLTSDVQRGTVSGPDSLNHGEIITISATPLKGYKFKKWKIASGSAIIADTNSASTTITMVNGDAVVEGVFSVITFIKVFGRNDDDEGYFVNQTSDNGFIIAGTIGSFQNGNSDIYLIKTNADGDSQWTKTFGGSYGDIGYSVQQTIDSGYIITGCITSGGNRNVYLIKTNSTGDTSWTKTFGGSYDDEGFSAKQTSDGGYIITGYTYETYPGNVYAYLIKTNSNGVNSWIKKIGGTIGSTVVGYDIEQTSNGGYIISGINTPGTFYLIKTNDYGDTTWTKKINKSSLILFGKSVKQTLDNGYLIVGTSAGSNDHGVFIAKTNSYGDTIWTKLINSNGGGCSIERTMDDGYIIGGTVDHLIKLDLLYNIIWTKTFNGVYCNHVQQASDGGYILTGKKDGDIILIKTDENGNVE